jgi:modified peptide precursor CbpA
VSDLSSHDLVGGRQPEAACYFAAALDGKWRRDRLEFPVFRQSQHNEEDMNKAAPKKAATAKKDVVACRKSCKAKGTGLSHYILADKKSK